MHIPHLAEDLHINANNYLEGFVQFVFSASHCL